ncbi:MAG: beta strand repeat-containing protein, partial [Bacteroidota bacterium]
IGIHHSSSLGCTISQNTISNISNINTTATTNIIVTGISSANSTQTTTLTTTITRNKIFGLSNLTIGTTATAPPIVAGILIRSGNYVTMVANNMISLGNGQSTNTVFVGILANHGSTPDPSDKIYNNTVNIEGTVTSGALPSFCFNRGDLTGTARTITLDLKNNIFNNTRTGGTGSHYAIANNYNATASATGWSANASNYNVLNAASGTVGYWTSAQTISGWQTASGGDLNSLSSQSVPFVNTATGDLHLNYGAIPTQLESGGTPISVITNDFDNDTRPGPTGSTNGGGVITDIGADEFDAVPLDLIPPVINYTPITNSCTPGSKTLTVTITDVSSTPHSGTGLPVAYFKVNSGSYTGVTGTWVSGTTYNFTIGTGSVVGDTISYYVVAQDNLNSPNIGCYPAAGAAGFTANPPTAATPPTNPSKYVNVPTLSGTYSVGVGGTYPTLTAAIATVNTACLNGTVTLSLTDASYPSETFPIIINALQGTGSLIIKPTGTTSIIGSSTTSLIQINGADNVTIDGSSGSTSNSICPLSAASRNLTFTNISPTNTSAVIWLSTTPAGDPVTNCTVKNCIIVGSGTSVSSTIVGLGAGSSSIGNGGTNNDNISFINNDIRACQFGIYAVGASATNKNQNLLISQNYINTPAPNNIGETGIYVAATNNVTISGNTVGNVINAVTSQDAVGINVGFGAVNGFTATNTGIADCVSNVTITNNTIGTVNHSNTFSAIGIGLGNTISGSSLIANNMIYGVASNGTSGDYCTGIALGGGTAQVNVYHNTVYMQGTLPGAAAGTQTSTCLSINSAAVAPVNIRNNIFSNTQAGNTSATTRFTTIALSYSSTVGNYVSLVSNNNDLYTAGTGPGSYVYGITGGVATGTSR